MMTIRYLVLLTILFNNSSCRTSQTHDDENSNKLVVNGDYVTHYPDGTRKCVKSYKDTVLFQMQFWHENGKMERKVTYDTSGNEIDTTQVWYSSGQLMLKSIFLSVDTYQVSEYWLNGQMKNTGLKVNNRRFGPWKEWFENNQVRFEGSYVLCKLEDETATMKTTLHSCQSGLWSEWYESGVKKSEGDYIVVNNGSGKTGPWMEWWPNGSLKSKLNFDLAGRRHGKQERWPDEGEALLVTEYFEHGVLVRNPDR